MNDEYSYDKFHENREQVYRLVQTWTDTTGVESRSGNTTALVGTAWDGEDHATGRVAQLYGGYIVPGSTLSDLQLVVSQWNTATNWPYHVMQFHTDVSELLQ